MVEALRHAPDGGSAVLFAVEPLGGFCQVPADRVVGRIREAVAPAVGAAWEALDQIEAHGPFVAAGS